ncbi:glycosyltransferase [Dasania marina]|uniref:glycosyltransferase n=1 Tax=Dasania marina TaxID=471499 RepID=UPI00035CDA0F|nr:glycosyltransferase [Dasania marina]
MDIGFFHTANSDYVRVKKIMESFLKKGDKITYYGAVRGSEKWNILPSAIYSGVRLPHGLRSIFSYVVYLVKAIYFLRRIKADIVIVTNEELMLIPFLSRYKGYVCLDAIDALDIRRSDSILTKFFTVLARKRADLIVEVEEFRSDRFPEFKNKTVVVRNIPIRCNESKEENYKIDVTLTPFIFAYGSLRENLNGIEVLLDVLDKMNEDGRKCSLIIAGFIHDKDLLNDILRRSYICYVGKIKSEECMNIARRSIGVFAYYRPINLNFIMAAPNKYYEAQMSNVPLLINSECVISKSAEQKGFGLSGKYDDRNTLLKNINYIIDNRGFQKTIRVSDSWERDFDKLYGRLLNELSDF